MIELTHGNLLEADVEAIVNTVNCVGVMGKGIALQFKKAFPENFAVYKKACDAGAVKPGRMLVVKNLPLTSNPRFIINFPTKRHWKEQSRLEDITSGLSALIKEVQEHGIQSVAVPALGCGNGGLNWSDVLPQIESAFASLPEVHVLVFEPREAVSPRNMAASEIQKVVDALAGIMEKETAELWLTSPNSAFDGAKPVEVIERGDIDRVWRMVHLLESGQPG